MSRLSQKSPLNFDFNEEDTNNDDDDAVSDVDPEELQKMLEVSAIDETYQCHSGTDLRIL